MAIRRLFRLRSRSKKQGSVTAKPLAAPPGTLIHVGEKRAKETTFTEMTYDSAGVSEVKGDFDELQNDDSKVSWVDVVGLHDIELIKKVGKRFEIGNLALEDILNTNGRPKIEDFDDAVFVVMKMITRGVTDSGENEIDSQHFAMLLLPGKFIITFREAASGIFKPIRDRIRSGAGRIRNSGADYLAWAILDAVVDNYLDVIGLADEMLSDFEYRLDINDSSVEIGEIHTAKREVIQLYRQMRPVREITNTLYRTDSKLINSDSAPYFRDLHDHSVQAEETIADLREAANSLRDYYHTVVSNRMNEVMKVLTSLSTIFLPLTFLAGIYGMNFEKNMPELHWEYSYPIFWAVSIAIAVGLYVFFKRRGWL